MLLLLLISNAWPHVSDKPFNDTPLTVPNTVLKVAH